MNTKDINGTAPEEQSGNGKNDTGNSEKKDSLNKKPEPEAPETDNVDVGEADNQEVADDEPEKVTDSEPETADEQSVDEAVEGQETDDETEEDNQPEEAVSEPGTAAEDKSAITESGAAEEEEATDTEAGVTEKEVSDAASGLAEETEANAPETADAKPAEDEEPEVADVKTGKADTQDAGEDQSEKVSDTEPEKAEKVETTDDKSGIPDFQSMEKDELLKVLEDMVDTRPVQGIRNDVEAIKVCFYKRHKADIEQKRKKFMQEGGDAEAFDPGEDPAEVSFKEIYRRYRHSKAALNRSMEQTRQDNLEDKLKVVEDLKELIKSNEDINRTFPEFRKLQKRWHEIGMVPQQNLKDLWDTYHHHVETFYDHIKINRELRDLDLKKNLEIKIELCEKTEELLLESNIIAAFRQLQKYHEQWRETGPVPRDQKDVIWERFREVTHQINKKHQEHFDNLKETQKKNLDTKTSLCEQAETINDIPFENFQQVEKLTREMISLQRTWKTIGFAPKKDNTKIYQRFRSVCDKFFSRKREFNTHNKEYLNENLQKKMDLCVQAEALKDSTDWKRTTDELISLQKRWKEIGPVPRKHYDSVWKRFRAACDHFFDRKSDFFANIDSRYEDNLRKKLELLEKIENFRFSGNLDQNLNTLKEYQREWVSIGFVPIREKENIQKRYRAALDNHFEGLKMDENKKSLMKYRHKLEGVKEKPNSFNKLKFEREKFLNRFKQLESDITLWENNIGFFARSKTADATIKEFREKIEMGKKQMELLEEKIRLIDELDPE